MSKGKFELVFMGGGLLLNVLANQLRRPASTPRERIGETMYEVTEAVHRWRDEVTDPDALAVSLVGAKLALSADDPDLAGVCGHIEHFRTLVNAGALSDEAREELTAAIDRLDTAVEAWLS